MADKCFCHLIVEGVPYEVKDANARRQIEEIIERINSGDIEGRGVSKEYVDAADEELRAMIEAIPDPGTGDVSGKLDKITGIKSVYVMDANGNPALIAYSDSSNANTIVHRDANGYFNVKDPNGVNTKQPINISFGDGRYATKSAVSTLSSTVQNCAASIGNALEQLTALEERVAALESGSGGDKAFTIFIDYYAYDKIGADLTITVNNRNLTASDFIYRDDNPDHDEYYCRISTGDSVSLRSSGDSFDVSTEDWDGDNELYSANPIDISYVTSDIWITVK